MQNKLAATFGMPRLFPNPFSPFFPLFRRFAVAYLNAAGQQKKESRRKRKICDNFVSLSLVSGWATKILGNILGPVSIFLAPLKLPLLILLQTKIPVNCRRAINQRGVIKGKNISGIAARKRHTKICAWLYSNWQKTILNNYDNLKSS